MSEHYDTIWKMAGPLVEQGLLGRDEVESAAKMGLGYKPGVTEKIIGFLEETARNPTHQKEQACLRRFGMTREVFRQLRALAHEDEPSVKVLKAWFKASWPRWRTLFEAGGWIVVSYTKDGRPRAVTATEKYREFIHFWREGAK